MRQGWATATFEVAGMISPLSDRGVQKQLWQLPGVQRVADA